MNRNWLLFAAGTLSFLLPPTLASAQGYESLDGNAIEFRIGRYTPAIDDEFEAVGPYETVFGDKGMLSVEAGYERQLYDGFGRFGLGLRGGFSSVRGDSLDADGNASPDETSLRVLPVRLEAVYRMDELAQRFNIPLVPVIRAGVGEYFWSVRDANGLARWSNADDDSLKARGSTTGTHLGFGAFLLLDIFSPRMASNFDESSGVNNSYLFVDYQIASVSDFGAEDSWDLSSNSLNFGLAFEF